MVPIATDNPYGAEAYWDFYNMAIRVVELSSGGGEGGIKLGRVLTKNQH